MFVGGGVRSGNDCSPDAPGGNISMSFCNYILVVFVLIGMFPLSLNKSGISVNRMTATNNRPLEHFPSESYNISIDIYEDIPSYLVIN